MTDNARLQKLINGGGLVNIPVGSYMIDPVIGLKASRPTTINFTGTTITALPTTKGSYSMLTMEGDDIHIIGGTFIGERKKHQGTEGEWGFGIYLRHGNKMSVHSTFVQDCWGDGVYIGGASDVIVQLVTCTNNRRQGLSLVEGKDVRIIHSTFELTNGTPPGCGIDIEPNKGNVIDTVLIEACKFRQNKGDAHINIAGKKGTAKNITVVRCSYDSSAIPIKLQADYPDLWARVKGKFGDYSGYPTSIKNYTQEGRR